eukprot:CAMPEP_0170510246 /NCGR_PEP_ID=MMETSP0208-20121228/65667_1 /TAXON_ID=197538 /ORGANISM="Strombidium inclinatum, Strain S3" /LENGTH=55 /DNA_ID=CAMNT_0010793697 /DNA_START=757 /DNA_END=924 /DNA_ORIENTATION=+
MKKEKNTKLTSIAKQNSNGFWHEAAHPLLWELKQKSKVSANPPLTTAADKNIAPE